MFSVKVKSGVVIFLLGLFFWKATIHAFGFHFCRVDQVINQAEILKTIGQANQTSFANSHLKILVWNLHKGAVKGWAKEFPKLVGQADIILAQESYIAPVMTDVFENDLPNTLQWNFATSYIHDDYPTGDMIGAEVAPTYVDYVISPVLEPIIKTPKMIVLVEYQVNVNDQLKPLWIATIHGSLVTKNSAFEKQLNGLGEKIKNYKGAMIFAGDFNTWNSGRIKILKAFMKKHGLVNVPWQNDPAKINSFVLDHAYTRGLCVTNASYWHHIKTSDHKPMYFEVDFMDK